MLAEDFGYLRTDNIVYYCAESCYCTILEAMGDSRWIILYDVDKVDCVPSNLLYESKEHFEDVYVIYFIPL